MVIYYPDTKTGQSKSRLGNRHDSKYAVVKVVLNLTIDKNSKQPKGNILKAISQCDRKNRNDRTNNLKPKILKNTIYLKSLKNMKKDLTFYGDIKPPQNYSNQELTRFISFGLISYMV